MTNQDHSSSYEGVAVIGMAGRFPGARNLEEYWQNIRDGVETITFFSDEELLAAGVPEEVVKHPSWVKAATILDDAEKFDAAFFDYTPREAQVMDPQQRVFLECAWEALEHGGYDPARYEGAIGVYAGASMSPYIWGVYGDPSLLAATDPFQIMIGNDKDFLATRVSYKLNLKGPSMTVQTACSTSLVAASLACQSLVDFQCDMALAGGVSINTLPKTGYMYDMGGINSPDGRCRAFDAKGAGTVGGQGVGIVLLKRLEDAINDGDTVYAVIKGWALNNDGSLKVGFTAPSVDGQAQVIAEAQAMAEFPPDSVTYIEAHGTGTNLGDPIEIAALTQAFRAGTDELGFCAIGSVKSNMGHADAAAGVAGLLKTVLALKHRTLPPSLHFETPNPQCRFESTPFYVNTSAREWTDERGPRRAGVSSFGIGGTNAHMVLEEAPTTLQPEAVQRPQVLALSARDAEALDDATLRLADYLKTHPGTSLADVAYTLDTGRHLFAYRRAAVCHDLEDAVQALESRDPRRVVDGVEARSQPSVAFMFTGQGAQHVNMASELYAAEPVFRRHVDECAELLQPHLGLDIRDVWFAPDATVEAGERLEQTCFTQPALFVLEYALTQLWKSWGVQPQAMIGHSIGEYVAACLAGVFSLQDALAVVNARGRLMQEMSTGGMLAISLSEPEVRSLLPVGLDLAAVNGPEACVVSGPMDTVVELKDLLETRGIDCRLLHTSHAFHSASMESMMEDFARCVASMPLAAPTIPFVSNVTGTWITPQQACDPRYWASHVRETVRFHDGIKTLQKDPAQIFLEVGPGTTLSRLATTTVAESRTVLASLGDRRQRQRDTEAVLLALGALWTVGVPVQFAHVYGEPRKRVPLPTYPFQRKSYHFDMSGDARSFARNGSAHAWTKDDWVLLPTWQRTPPPVADPASLEMIPVLVFLDPDGTADCLAQRLLGLGHRVVTIAPGDRYEQLDDETYRLCPGRQEDYELLLNDLHAFGRTDVRIIHAWSLTTDAGENAFKSAQERGFYSLLYLVQAFVRHDVTERVDVTVLSNCMQQIGPGETVRPEAATLLGPCRVVPQEHSNIGMRSVDIVSPDRGTWAEALLLDQLVAEVLASPEDRMVAYRGHERFIQDFDVAQPPSAPTAGVRLRQGGVYLITGGLGGLGLVFAEYLARTQQARLVLVGRTGLPPRDRWDSLTGTEGSATLDSGRIQIIRHLEGLGAEVLDLAADVADREQMQGVMEAIEERFGALHGVVHGAGTTTGPSIRSVQDISADECEIQFRPKVHGLYVLESVLGDRELDFCLLMSSISTVLGGLHFVAYAAANSFMDAYVHRHNLTSRTPWISVDWDAWRSEDLEEPASGLGARTIQSSLTPRTGMETFERLLLLGPVPRAVVSVTDLRTRIEQWIQLSQDDGAEAVAAAGKGRMHPRPALGTAYVAPSTAIESTIAQIWSELLGIEPIGVEDDFFELGGHSLLGVRLLSRLRDTYHVQVSLDVLFDGPTIAHIASMVTERQLEFTDEATLSELLQELGELSEEEALELLAQADGGPHA